MPVQLDANGRPVAWSDDDRVDGKDIPLPPDPPRDHYWDGSSWVNDPVETVPTNDEILAALNAGNITQEQALKLCLGAKPSDVGAGSVF